MAYAGTTSTAPNVPKLTSQSLDGSHRHWVYVSTHLQGIISSSGFFTDGRDVGLQVGDTMMAVGTTTYLMSFHTVNVVTSTGAGLTFGLIVSSAS